MVAARTLRGARRFYEAALTEAERHDLPVALGLQGFDEEIAMLRLRLRSALKDRPEDLALMFRGVDVLRRLVAARYGISKSDQRQMTPFAEETLRRVKERGEGTSDG